MPSPPVCRYEILGRSHKYGLQQQYLPHLKRSSTQSRGMKMGKTRKQQNNANNIIEINEQFESEIKMNNLTCGEGIGSFNQT